MIYSRVVISMIPNETWLSFSLDRILHLRDSISFSFCISVGTTAWQQLIDLYPFLVQCVTATSTEISSSLQDALHQYSVLLQPKLSA